MMQKVLSDRSLHVSEQSLLAAFPDIHWAVSDGAYKFIAIGRSPETFLIYTQFKPIDIRFPLQDQIFAVAMYDRLTFDNITIEQLKSSSTIAEACIRCLLDRQSERERNILQNKLQ